MTEFETRFSEFREDFRKAALNGFIDYTVEEEPEYSSYIASIRFKMYCDDVHFVFHITVAKDYICYHTEAINQVFRKEDMPRIHQMINEALDKDKEKRARIKELKKELKELEEELEEAV